MATSTSTVSTAVRQEATNLLEGARQLCNNDFNLDEAYVSIEVLKGTQKVLNDLCAKELSNQPFTRTGIEGTLKKVQNKLQRAEQLNTFLRSDNRTDVDPRVERIMGKIYDQKLTSYSPSQANAVHGKLTKWDAILRTCSIVSNEPTKQTAASSRSSISEIEMELLQHAPHIVTFNHPLLGRSSDRYYQNQPNREECAKLASGFYAKQYLTHAALGLDNHRFENDGLEGCGELAHESTAEYLQTHGFVDGISAESLFPGNATEYIEAVSFPTSFSCKEISFPSNANVDEIQKQIDNLIDLKKATQFKWIGAFIEIKPQMLAIVLHPSGRISLVNPCGSKTSPNSYEANFANSKQAAEFLKNLIAEMGSNNPIVFKPYSKTGAIPETTETFISSSSSSSSKPALETKIVDYAWVEDPFAGPASNTSSSSSSSSRPQKSNHPTIQYTTEFRSLGKIAPDIYPLQQMTLAFKSKEGFSLAEKSFEELSKRTGNLSTTILDRACFHLYHIQDKETPNLVNRQDNNWGFSAFTTEGLATPEQRLRAAQRVQVEMLFDYIKVAILMDAFEPKTIDLYFNALEELKLDRKDCPTEQTNPAHALFGKLYTNYVEARSHDQSLEDPHDAKFRGDFGRNAFRGDVPANIPVTIKTKVLEEVEQAFKATWRI